MDISLSCQLPTACDSEVKVAPSISSERAHNIAERARQLEIVSYLQAASIPLDSPHENSALPAPATLSRDPNLSALVQLGALRLDCDRAFVSLIDGTHQYIVAESTRSASIAELGRWAPNDAIYLGVQTLNVSFGVCPNTMMVFTDTTGKLAVEAPNVTADRTRYIIRDFQAEAHYRDRPYVKGWPFMRSYAEVPLISPLGYVIGSYCVVDNKLRDFDDETVFVLDEVAKTIMAHLDLTKSKQTYARSQRLMKGLTFFMEGDSTISNQDSALKDRGKVVSVARHQVVEPAQSPSKSEQSLSNTDSRGSDPLSSGSDSSQKLAQTPLTTPLDTIDDNPFDESHMPLFEGDSSYSLKDNRVLHAETLGTSVEESVVSSNVRAVFYRAAALIRQTTNMDGVIFLDACPSGFNSQKNDSMFAAHSESDTDTKSEELPSTHPQTSCARLASSIESSSGVGTAGLTKDYLDLPEALLQRFIRRYPRGRIFSADDLGPIDEAYPLSLVQGSTKGKRHADVEALFRFLPNARYVIFYPLWHYQKEVWFSAALGWTTDPINSFGASDITYMSAFGNALMAEVSRFEAMDISYAKSDFISSLSHEIRSPLHGILASAELLRQSQNVKDQSALLDMIESCGSTLLDTMNHLLDYAKINKLAVSTTDQNGAISSHNPQKTQSSMDSSTDLAVLVQEVVDGVYVGHKSGDVRDKLFTEADPMDPTVAVHSAKWEDPVKVTVYIEKQPSWRLKLTTGAWKRIVMNLFGNALKYTPSGHIEVRLRIVSLADTSGTNRDHIAFCVKDTGIGIRPEFMRYQLFHPFSQENGLSVGTGLGLSIVHQIVKSLGGKIDVQSKVGVGTRLEVFIPLGAAEIFESLPVLDPESKLKDRTICIVNPCSPSTLDRMPNNVGGSGCSGVFQTCVAQIASEWLNMKTNIVFADTLDAAEADAADIFVVDGSCFHDRVTQSDGICSRVLARRQKPIIVLNQRHVNGDSYGIDDRRAIHLHHPIGPKKLASALLDALALDVTAEEPHHTTAPATAKTEPIETDIGLKSGGFAPVSVAQEQEELRPPPRAALHGGSEFAILPAKQHVMVVDDNIVNCKILTTYVKRLGCSYVVASDGLQAVEAYKTSSKPFDFVFMDISMPVMNGFAATREIRSHEQATQRTPTRVVALTGLGSAASQQEALASGVDLYLVKPVSLNEVRKLLTGEREA